MAIAVAVLALLLGSILVPLQTQIEERQVSDTQKYLENIRDALVGFAVTNGFLPCPDLTSGTGSNDGVEDVVSGTGFCNASSITGSIAFGNLPWSTLGISNSTDPWGNRFRYAVIENFARRSPASTFTLTTTVASASALRICTTAACTTALTDSSRNTVVAVILSHGKNGWGAINSQTNTATAAPTSADELENTDTDTNFVYRERTAVGTTAGEFDDVVIWLSRMVLLNRMVAAGKLP